MSWFCEAYKTEVSRNENLAKLQAGYLFPEVSLHHSLFIVFIMFLEGISALVQTFI